MPRAKTYTCHSCGTKSEKIGVSSSCTQTLNLTTDDWTNLDVGDTHHGFCLECAVLIPAAKLKKLTGLQQVSFKDYQGTLINLVNSAETAGCDNCATISLEALNKARKILGYK